MSKKEPSVSSSDTMWPEKVVAIYKQFPWLEKVFSREKVVRAQILRFQDDTLEMATDPRYVDTGFLFSNYVAAGLDISIYLVSKDGDNIVSLGREVGSSRFLFWKYSTKKYFRQTVREAIQDLLSASWMMYTVVIEHKKGNTLTVYKPPQNGVLLKDWYQDRVSEIENQISTEATSAD